MQWRYPTLIKAMEAAAQSAGPQTGYIFLDGMETNPLTFAELWQRARAYAGALQQQGVKKGDRVLVIMPTSADFAAVYLGLLLSGAAPCVLPTPDNTRNRGQAIRRVLKITAQLSARLLVTTPEPALSQAEVGARVQVCTIAELQTSSAPWQPVAVDENDLALIQASSGTTGAPKCIALTHSNILANLEQIGRRLQVTKEDVVVCWLPLFHDMGLVGCFLFTLYWQLSGLFMTPHRFLRRPATWLKAISDYGGTLSPAPAYAYALTARRLTEEELARLDLSTWRAAICGAEAIDVETAQHFIERLVPYGFRPESFVPYYGLAEAALGVTMRRPGERFGYERLARSTMVAEGVAVVLNGTETTDATLVCDCGPVLEGNQVRILDETGRELPEGHIGQVWIAGPSVTQGYYNLPQENERALRDGWLNTGDLGYLRGGHLFVTGPSQDLIVVGGHTYQPTEFEWAAAQAPGIAAGRVVAFGVSDPDQATGQLYLVCERPRKMAMSEQALCETIKRHVERETGVLPASVALVPRNTILRTTSGKLQRTRTKSLYFKLSPKEVIAI